MLGIISAAMTGWKIGTGGVSLWYGKHGDTVAQAFDLLEDFENSSLSDYSALESAIGLFLKVPSDEKDYLKVGANYGLAKCFAYKNQYNSSYRCLDYIASVEIGFFTACSDTIKEIQESAIDLREEIEEREKVYLESMKNASGDNFQSGNGNSKWIFLFVAFALVLIIIAICYFLFK